MRDALGQGTALGYCTNVHAGATVEKIKANLTRHALAGKQRVSPAAPMGVGLWLAAPAARALLEDGGVAALRDFLGERWLVAFTFNGFPYADFHQPVVKHRVYEPSWSEPARLAYTKDLIAVLAGLLPDGDREGSISTLPLGWKTLGADSGRVEAAAANLLEVAEHLRALEQETGRLIHLDLEPEPGCLLERGEDVVRFFGDHLSPTVTRYLRVCHDVCHAAVMFEDQAETLRRYDAAGIKIGKVQVSSAVRVDFDAITPEERREALRQLRGFVEPRYLHQTMVRERTAGSIVFHEDLPAALSALPEGDTPAGEWRVHFHVPVYLERFGLVGTTRQHILQCLDLLKDAGVRHWEVETYAWEVLPEQLRHETLAEGIAEELSWFLQAAGAPCPTEGPR